MSRAPSASTRPFRPLARLLSRGIVRQTAAVGGLVWALVALGGLGQALLMSAVVPDLDLLGRMALASAGAAAGLAVPIGVVGGVVAGTRRLAEEGGWLGLRSLGAGGRRIAGVVAGLAIVGALAWLGVGHVVEPASRQLLREARVSAAARVRPVEGQPVTLGTWTAVVEDDQLHFAGGDWIGSARRWETTPASTGIVVHLEEGQLVRADGTGRARFATLDMPIGVAGTSGKIHASERTTPDLRRQIAVSAALGRDRYERWILWKRSLLPVCLFVLALAAVPFGLSGRRSVVGLTGGMIVSLWGAVRVADQALAGAGLWGAAAVVFVGVFGWLAAGWWRWRDA